MGQISAKVHAMQAQKQLTDEEETASIYISIPSDLPTS